MLDGRHGGLSLVDTDVSPDHRIMPVAASQSAASVDARNAIPAGIGRRPSVPPALLW